MEKKLFEQMAEHVLTAEAAKKRTEDAIDKNEDKFVIDHIFEVISILEKIDEGIKQASDLGEYEISIKIKKEGVLDSKYLTEEQITEAMTIISDMLADLGYTYVAYNPDSYILDIVWVSDEEDEEY